MDTNELEKEQLGYGKIISHCKRKEKIKKVVDELDSYKHLPLETGTVVMFRGNYGFIRPDDKELPDVKVDYEQIEPLRDGYKTLLPSDHVEFRLRKGDKGYEALDLQIMRNKHGRD